MSRSTQRRIDPERLVIHAGIEQGCIGEPYLANVGAVAVNKAVILRRKDPEAFEKTGKIPELEGEIAMEKEVAKRAAKAYKGTDDIELVAKGAGIAFTLYRMANERKGVELRQRLQ